MALGIEPHLKILTGAIVCWYFVGSAASPDVEGPTPLPATSALEEMALYSNKRKLRQGRRSLETAVPT